MVVACPPTLRTPSEIVVPPTSTLLPTVVAAETAKATKQTETITDKKTVKICFLLIIKVKFFIFIFSTFLINFDKSKNDL